jgi:hypothetical protein
MNLAIPQPTAKHTAEYDPAALPAEVDGGEARHPAPPRICSML